MWCREAGRRGACARKDLYTSSYFSLKRRYAEEIGDFWSILSAEHGLLPPTKEILPYETSIDDLDEDQRDHLAHSVGMDLIDWIADFASQEIEVERVVVLAGRSYLDPLRSRDTFSSGISPRVDYPLQQGDLGGIGQQMSWLKDRVESQQYEQSKLVTDGGVEEDSAINRIECYSCGDVIDEWCETRRYGFWDAESQNYDSRPTEQRKCRECWSDDEGRANGAHFHPESAQHLWDVLEGANGSLAGILCWWTGRPAIRVVDGDVQAAVTKPTDGGEKPDGTPILKFQSEYIDGFDREQFFEDAEPPENEDMNLVRLLKPERTPFGALDGDSRE